MKKEELPFYEDEFEFARMNLRGIQVKNDFISAMKLWRSSKSSFFTEALWWILGESYKTWQRHISI